MPRKVATIYALQRRFHADTWALACITLGAYLLYGLEKRLVRDNAVYYYSAKQLNLGVPPLLSFFDIKPPLTSFFSGVGVALAPLFDVHELIVVRALYLPLGLLTILATQRLAKDIWNSRWIAWVAGLSLLALEPLLFATLAGPRPKVLVLFCVVTAMLAITRSRFMTAGVLGSLAFLSWQPGGIVLLTASVSLMVFREGTRELFRLVLGAAIPVLLMSAYYVWVGGFQEFLDATLLIHFNYPVHSESPLVHLYRMGDTAMRRLGIMFLPVMVGCFAFFFLSARALMGRGVGNPRAFGPSALCFALFFAFSLRDFQGIPDWIPMLPFACIGFGKAGWELARWAGSRVPFLKQAIAWAGLAFCAFAVFLAATENGHGLLQEQEERAQQILREFEAHDSVAFVGATEFLAFSDLTSPTPHVLITRIGVAQYMNDRVPGGMTGWLERQRARDPKIIVVRKRQNAEGSIPPEVEAWIQKDRVPSPYKNWIVFSKRP